MVSDVKSRWRNWDYLFDDISKDIHKMYDVYVLLFLDYLIIISLSQIYMNVMELSWSLRYINKYNFKLSIEQKAKG